jgi:hypothetical protein
MTTDLTSPEKILAVPLAEAGRLFSGNRTSIRTKWRRLAAKWHPDHHAGKPEAEAAFIHLARLRDTALDEWKNLAGVELTFTGTNGRTLQLHSIANSRFEIGTVHICREGVAFCVDRAERNLFENARSLIAGLGFTTSDMADQMSASMPLVLDTLETDEQLIMLLERGENHVVLADLVAFLGGKLDPRHVAWIISGLCNIACYLNARGIVHGAIDLSAVVVDPARHHVALIGGWFYASTKGTNLQALPTRSVAVLPSIMVERGRAELEIDLLLIRHLAAELLGDPTCSLLLRDPDFPAPFAAWLNGAPAANAFADYASWEHARDLSFGPRRFINLPVIVTDIYPALASGLGSTEE